MKLIVGFLLRPAQKCQRRTFLDNLRIINQKNNIETKQMTSIFHVFFRLYLFVTVIFVSEYSQNLFLCGPHFVPFWSVKYINFG